MKVKAVKVWWIACILAQIVFLQTLCCGNDNIQANFDQAVDLYNSGQREKAQPKLEEVIALANDEIRKNPANASAYRLRAEAKGFFVRYDYDEVLADIERAIQLDPKAARGYYTRGKFLVNRKNPREAIKDLKKAIEIDPTNWEYHNVCGFCQMRLSDFEQAILNFNDAIRLNPASWNSFQLRAESLYSLGKYEKALVDYLAAHRLVKKPSTRLNYTTAECYYQLEDYRRAIQYMSKSFNGSPDDVNSYLYLGHCHNALREWKEALANYDRAIELNPKDGLFHHCRAIALSELGRSQEATEAFAKSKQLGYAPDSK